MDIQPAPQRFWLSERFDLALSLLIGFLTASSFANLFLGLVAAVVVLTVLKYANARSEEKRMHARDMMVQLPVQAL